MIRQLVVCSLALLVSATSCNSSYVIVRAPITSALDADCLRKSLGELTNEKTTRSRRLAGKHELRSVAYRLKSGDADLAQVIRRDSSIFLEATYGRANQRFFGDQPDSAVAALTRLLLRVRSTCGGEPPAGAKEVVAVSNDPPSEVWLSSGMRARVSVRQVIDRYRLQVDSLGRPPGDSEADSSWVALDKIMIPRPAKGYVLATECGRNNASADGSIIAVARASKREIYTEIVQAWHLDTTTLRLSAGSTEGIQCRSLGPTGLGGVI
jgi:hypothetical protein